MLPNRVFVVPSDAARDMESTMFVAAMLAARHDAAIDLLEIARRQGPSYRDGSTRQASPGVEPMTTARDGSRVRTVGLAGDALDVICAHAQAVNAALIIVGRNFGTSRWRRGSRFVNRLARSAPVPVLVVPPGVAASDASLSFREIVAAVDHTVASAVVVRTVLGMTQRNRARLTLVHAIASTPRHLIFSGGEAKEIARDVQGEAVAAAERMERANPSDGQLQVIARVIPGRPHRAILQAAAEATADLIVMGVPPRSRLDELLFGSTLRGVLRRSQVPVMVLPVPAGDRAWVDRTVGDAQASEERANGDIAERFMPIDRVSEASFESFPASDPPAWSSLRIGPPREG